MPRKPAKKAAWGGRIGGWCLDKRVPVRGRKRNKMRAMRKVEMGLDKRVPVRGRKQEKEETETKEQETV